MSALASTDAHPHARAVLGAALGPQGNASHAYLFHGPAGAGKRTAARELAAALLSEGARDPADAGDRARRGVHPDLMWIVPSGAAEMLVSDVGDLPMAVAKLPFEARRTVVVIERADTLIDAAANKLLKTLEEPPAHVHLVLLTDRPAEMLPTIASRCQDVRFEAPSPAALAARLTAQGVTDEAAGAAARLALGDARRAEAIALGDGPALRAAAERFARAARAGELAQRPWTALLRLSNKQGDAAAAAVEAAVEAALETAGRSERTRIKREGADAAKRAQRRARTAALDLGLALTGLWFRDLAAVSDGAPELAFNSDRAAELGEDAAGLAGSRARAALELVDDTRQRLSLFVNEELALDALASKLARALS